MLNYSQYYYLFDVTFLPKDLLSIVFPYIGHKVFFKNIEAPPESTSYFFFPNYVTIIDQEFYVGDELGIYVFDLLIPEEFGNFRREWTRRFNTSGIVRYQDKFIVLNDWDRCVEIRNPDGTFVDRIINDRSSDIVEFDGHLYIFNSDCGKIMINDSKKLVKTFPENQLNYSTNFVILENNIYVFDFDLIKIFDLDGNYLENLDLHGLNRTISSYNTKFIKTYDNELYIRFD